MNVEIRLFREPGNLDKERLVLRMKGADDIGRYAVFVTELLGEGASSEVRNTFWFPDKDVSAGDFIVLYTRQGNESTKTNPTTGSITHFYYWGLDHPLWNDKTNVAVVVHMNSWVSKTVVEASE